jgi:SsrA-binding protein
MAPVTGKNKEPRGPATIENRKARHDFEALDTHEAGLVLVGSEVKSLFLGRASLVDAYCQIKDGELWLLNMDIEPYEKTAHFHHERRRARKLLMHRREIDLLRRKGQERGLALIPLKIYFNEKGRAKALIAVARGRKQYDKREAIKSRETARELARGE